MTSRTLDVCLRYSGRGVMTEVEEDLFEVEVDEAGKQTLVLDAGDSKFSMDWTKLPAGSREHCIEECPQYEL